MPEDPGVRPASIWFFITSNLGAPQGHVLSPVLYFSDLTSPSARTQGHCQRSVFYFSSQIFFFFELPPEFSENRAAKKSYERGKCWEYEVGGIAVKKMKFVAKLHSHENPPKKIIKPRMWQGHAGGVSLQINKLKKAELIIKRIMATNECAALPPEFSAAVSACWVNLLRFVCFCLISRTFRRL